MTDLGRLHRLLVEAQVEAVALAGEREGEEKATLRRVAERVGALRVVVELADRRGDQPDEP